MITIRRAELKDIPIIMEFLDEHWEHNFALATDVDFFKWQYVKDDKVNIWIGIDDENGKLYSMHDCVIYSDKENPDISGTLWISQKSENPILAFEVADKMWRDLGARATFSPGLREKAIRINKMMGNTVVYMDHYYRLGDCEEYKIAKVNDKTIPSVSDFGYSLELMEGMSDFKNTIDERVLTEGAPSKKYDYVEWRYFNHPIYKYKLYRIVDADGNADAAMVTREVLYNSRLACKIVDYYGDYHIIEKLTSAIDSLISKNKYEFIDFYSYGIPTGIYEKAGFLRCDKNTENIIPNYFQPFVQENVEIAMVKPDAPNAIVFRGDSGQDRPRFLDNLAVPEQND